jgi:hypothetical protein
MFHPEHSSNAKSKSKISNASRFQKVPALRLLRVQDASFRDLEDVKWHKQLLYALPSFSLRNPSNSVPENTALLIPGTLPRILPQPFQMMLADWEMKVTPCRRRYRIFAE